MNIGPANIENAMNFSHRVDVLETQVVYDKNLKKIKVYCFMSELNWQNMNCLIFLLEKGEDIVIRGSDNNLASIVVEFTYDYGVKTAEV